MADDEIVEYVDEGDKKEELENVQRQLRERYKAAGIEVVEKEMEAGETYIAVGMPNGRDKRLISLFGLENYKAFLSVQFEKYVFLGDYDAICSYENSTIEAAIRTMLMLPSQIVKQRLMKTMPLFTVTEVVAFFETRV